MRVFVASWFFPPNASSEGFVTYKLLRNSRFAYDVVSAAAISGGYDSQIPLCADNVRVVPVKTSELEAWVDRCVAIFESNYKTAGYRVVMTRSMPAAAVMVGLRIKRRHPDVKWIASFGDPIAGNPYRMADVVASVDLPEEDKLLFLSDMGRRSCVWHRDWISASNPIITKEAGFSRLQELAAMHADLLLCPSEDQRTYMLQGCPDGADFAVCPHSFDCELYPAQLVDTRCGLEAGRINIAYLGSTDERRSLMPVIEAVRGLEMVRPELANRLSIHSFGNCPKSVRILAERMFADSRRFVFHGCCSYAESLEIMKRADWLLHLDAVFSDFIRGGGLFFAGKLADYLGAGKPILALTGRDSFAWRMIPRWGGLVCDPREVDCVADCLARIATGACVTCPTEVREEYDAVRVAAEFDKKIVLLTGDVGVESERDERPIVVPRCSCMFGDCKRAFRRMIRRCLVKLGRK